MKVRRVIGWSFVALLVVAIIAGVVLYILSTCQPGSYRPQALDGERQTHVAQDFISRRVVQDFGTPSEKGEPFEWSITQEELNNLLASMDELAYQLQPDTRGGRQKPVEQAMKRMNLSSPAASLQDGQITLMVFSEKYNRVLSADIGMAMTPEGKLRVQLQGTRVGQMPLPPSVVQEELDKLKQALPREAQNYQGSAAKMISSEDLARLVQQVLAAMNGEPIDPVLTWPGNKRKVRVDGLQITPDRMTVHLQPLPPGTK